MPKTIAIVQSNYLPWKGYFDLIGLVDEFVVYDDVQYRKNHWHNRNVIKSRQGLQWLTIPVSKAGGAFRNIDEISVATPFAEKHWKTIAQSYARAPFFDLMARRFEQLYARAAELQLLTEVNVLFMTAIAEILGFETRFVRSSDLEAAGDKTGRLIEICKELGAGRYLSGPSARAYLDDSRFLAAGVEVAWMDYAGYMPYHQLFGPFEHNVSIIDLLMNTGPDARNYMKAGTIGTTRTREEP